MVTLSTQNLRFDGSLLVLSPLYGNFRYNNYYVKIWGAGVKVAVDNAAFAGTGFVYNSGVALNVSSLAPGKYYCGFFAYTKPNHDEAYLYFSDSQFFSWDGSKGEFIDTEKVQTIDIKEDIEHIFQESAMIIGYRLVLTDMKYSLYHR